MGTTGVGLYANDMAMDLRSTIAAVARLPFDGDRLVEILCETEAPAANNPSGEDHANFWLVVADQFAKRAISCERVRETALAIIDSGSDLAMLAKLGMTEKDLAKRKKILTELRERIVAPAENAGRRNLLKKPQPFLFEVGDAFAYPTSAGHCINSYFSSKEKVPRWNHDGWAAMVIVERGRAFDFLAWYRPLTISHALSQKPALAQLRTNTLWVLKSPGTCSPVHCKRLELEKVGAFGIDGEKLSAAFPRRAPGQYQAVNDIGIVNSLSVGPYVPDVLMPPPGSPPNFSRGRPYPTIRGLNALLSEPLLN
jgi:hypothetical protein